MEKYTVEQNILCVIYNINYGDENSILYLQAILCLEFFRKNCTVHKCMFLATSLSKWHPIVVVFT